MLLIRNSLIPKNFLKLICHDSLVCSFTTTSVNRDSLSASQPWPDVPPSIVIPKRIKRDSTTILRALESTIKPNNQSPHYKYIDDPYLIPSSVAEKRNYALARASGEKAADYVLERYPRYLSVNAAVPTIDALMPPAAEPTHKPDTLEGLRERLTARPVDPPAAYASYQALRQNGAAIPDDCVATLLDLLCFYNNEKPSAGLKPDERYYESVLMQAAERKPPPHVSTWKNSGPAEEVFSNIEQKDSHAYASIIRGMAKYNEHANAYKLYQEMLASDVQPTLETYNAVLRCTSFVYNKVHERFDALQEIMRHMAKKEVGPSEQTFNSALYVCARASKYSRDFTVKLLAEMKRLQIEPSLFSWTHLLRIFYPRKIEESLPSLDVFKQVLDEVEKSPITVLSKDDTEFFSMAMSICSRGKDLESAYRLNSLLERDLNSLLLGEVKSSTNYYNNFLLLLCLFEQTDAMMDYYSRIVPHTFTPLFGTMREIIKAIELGEAYHHLPQIWSDCVSFGFTNKTDMMEPLLGVMAKKKHEPSDLRRSVIAAANYLRDKAIDGEQSQNIRNPLRLTGPLIGSLIQVYIHANEFESAWDTLEFYRDRLRSTEGIPSVDSLQMIASELQSRDEVDKLIEVAYVMSSCAYPAADELAAQLEEMNLNDRQRMRLKECL